VAELATVAEAIADLVKAAKCPVRFIVFDLPELGTERIWS
jgi:hypothetical protein